MTVWKPIETVPEYRTVLLGRPKDLYPVLGCKIGAVFLLEEGGPEDDERRHYPMLYWAPTHWTHAPEGPPL